MRSFARLFWVLSAFFLLATAVYVVWSYLYDAQGLATDPSGAERSPGIEWVGSVGLALACIGAALLAFYLGRTQQGIGQLLPEDRQDADIDDGSAEQGFFSPWSWWPFMLAGGGALMFLGVAVGIWIAIIGMGITMTSLVGWVYEYYRGNFAR
jgi:MFS family permease